MEENVMKMYKYPFNELKTKEYASVIISILKILQNNKEPISIQDALNILDDASKIILMITSL